MEKLAVNLEELMQTIVTWCNDNAGFASAVLALGTIIVSVIAIIVSLRTARLPYVKKIKITYGWYYGVAGGGIHITATNIGNRPVTISMIGMLIKNKQIIVPSEVEDWQTKIGVSELVTVRFLYRELIRGIKEAGFKENEIVYGYVTDTEGDTVKRRIGTVKDILQNNKR